MEYLLVSEKRDSKYLLSSYLYLTSLIAFILSIFLMIINVIPVIVLIIIFFTTMFSMIINHSLTKYNKTGTIIFYEKSINIQNHDTTYDFKLNKINKLKLILNGYQGAFLYNNSVNIITQHDGLRNYILINNNGQLYRFELFIGNSVSYENLVSFFTGLRANHNNIEIEIVKDKDIKSRFFKKLFK
ncbi:MAG: hypothetical protein JXJ22_13005 [Bacteroidales bacterium]|nr:hypothetical protein [Bacteroidales bacterium]